MGIVNEIVLPIKRLPRTFGGAKSIRLLLRGCTNRPFFHIAVMEGYKEPKEGPIEQLGTYDPLPNQFNEKLVAINFDRLEYWIQQKAYITTPVAKLLGLGGYFPIHPGSFEDAWRNRIKMKARLEKLEKEVEAIKAAKSDTSATTEPSSEENVSEDAPKT